MQFETPLESFNQVLSDLIKINTDDSEQNRYILEEIVIQSTDYFSQEESNFLKSAITLGNMFTVPKIKTRKKINLSLLNYELTNFVDINSTASTNYDSNLDRLMNIFIKYGEIRKYNIEDNKRTSYNFNVLNFFYIDETLHSRLLAKLLNPKSEHGQGNIFLFEFLKLIEIDEPTSGAWNVTAETGRIDILLKRSFPESIIIIENKSNWAGDQQNQLYRYWYQEIFSKTHNISIDFYEENKGKYKIIYLPPNENKQPEVHSYSRPTGERWLNRNLPEVLPLKLEVKTFNDFIVQWLNNCIIALPKTNHRMIEYLKQYIEICKYL